MENYRYPLLQRLRDRGYDCSQALVEICFAGLYDTVLSYYGSQYLPFTSNVLEQKSVARATKALHLAAAEEHRRDLSKKDISPHNKTATYGGYTDLEVRITPALQKLLNHPVGTLDFYIAVNTVAGWTLGFRVPLGNGVEIVTVARRVSFEDAPRSEIPNTWKHEIGHRLGMVAYGNKDHRKTNKNFQYRPWTPNAPDTVYGENRGINNQGHTGPHCSNGAKYHAPGTAMGGKHGKWTGQPSCVMFGADETDTGGKQANDFCPLCKPIVRKLDLSLPPTRTAYNSV